VPGVVVVVLVLACGSEENGGPRAEPAVSGDDGESRDREPSAAEAAGLDACESHEDCGQRYCLPTSETRFADESVCAPRCSRDADCSSGCCGELDTGEELCGFPADCAPAAIGNPCLNDTDCDSRDCRWGSCVSPCQEDGDCGRNLLGLANRCYRETRSNGIVDSACLPGCNDDSDCRFYFEEPYYSLNRELERVALECVEDSAGSHCL
jgi:hypothetical protein